jgi:hypothetical protein
MQMNTYWKHLKTILTVLLIPISVNTIIAEYPTKLRSTISLGGHSGVVSLNGKQLIIQQSIGQTSVINSFQAKGVLLRQGFIQPLNSKRSSRGNNELEGEVQPNPFSDYISISFSEVISNDIFITIINIAYSFFLETLLKEKGTNSWKSPNTDATNTFEFSAQGAGKRLDNGSFDYIKVEGNWWSKDAYSTLTAASLNLFSNYGNAFVSYTNKKYGMSVRCVKDRN